MEAPRQFKAEFGRIVAKFPALALPLGALLFGARSAGPAVDQNRFFNSRHGQFQVS